MRKTRHASRRAARRAPLLLAALALAAPAAPAAATAPPSEARPPATGSQTGPSRTGTPAGAERVAGSKPAGADRSDLSRASASGYLSTFAIFVLIGGVLLLTALVLARARGPRRWRSGNS